ncbi:hypothetical protein ACFQOY_00705 [Enterococcus alcedinis]|uniref:hypothetical protein n=1 Tax=Enterococcus alcedinis TaxID=1274384 RepID=UPI0036160681
MTIYSQTYHSPIGELILLSDGKDLTGVHYHRSEFQKKEKISGSSKKCCLYLSK